ncbi:MAG: response regulator, partial [Elusimicrobia bacterium]|nr:response regulator [Elusimicrobiota bacterium]
TLYLPRAYSAPPLRRLLPASLPPPAPAPGEANPAAAPELRAKTEWLAGEVLVQDDRESIQPGDRVVLIVEDDVSFAPVMVDLAREQGFKALVAQRGEVAITLAQKYKPDAITLDVRLPDMDGWRVLDLLKHDPATRHIPVHIVSVDPQHDRALKLGAIACLEKPVERQSLLGALEELKAFVDRQNRRLLIVEDDAAQSHALLELLSADDIETQAAASAKEALEVLARERFDCLVLDLGLADMPGFELLEALRKDESLKRLPIVIYTGRELTPQEETKLRRLAKSIIVKDARSPERLLDETSLLLHRMQAKMPERQRKALERLHQSDPALAHHKVLVVDDDVRNIFALTSVLEKQQMEVLYAENGRDAIELLEKTPGVDVVLMDVMMPEMDGYETMRAIRQIDRFRELPIVALTAKAMKGDREKCIEAGASDYIAKPVDVPQLLSMLRVWMYR